MEEPLLVKKETLTDRLIKKQKKVLVIAVFCVLTVIVGSSYALLTNFDKTDEVINIKTGNLTMTVNNTASLITIENKLPESDTNGLINATPVTITMTNSGTMNIMKYEVKLLNDTSNTSTLPFNYIKYAISEDGTNYISKGLIDASNNLIYTGYNLGVSESKTIYLKIWIDENAGNNALNKSFYGMIDVKLYQKAAIPGSVQVLNAANSIQNCTRTVVEDGITYISGKSDNPDIYAQAATDSCVIDFNYVWYSGKLWRITAIYPDGSMKLITENNITTIAFNNTVTYYDKTNGTKSYMFQWLNEDFLDTLYNHENIIDTTKYWNATMPENTTISTKPEETDATMIPSSTSPVGLLNNYEYYKSYYNTTFGVGYLNIGYYWWLLNPYSASSVWFVSNNGYGDNSPTNASGVRPSIYLKSDISFAGSGTKNDPFRITIDLDSASTNDLLNTRISGEYIKFASDGNNDNYDAAPLYRIVGTEGEGQNKTTKIVAMDFASYDNNGIVAYTKQFGAGSDASGVTWGTCTSNDCWNYYLNDTSVETGKWYPKLTFKDKLVMGTYYLGQVPSSNINYKLSVCNATNFDTAKTIKECIQNGTIATTWNSGYVGILRYGEMFATSQKPRNLSSTMWLITPYSTSGVWIVSSYGNGINFSPTKTYGVRPSYYLSSGIQILSGSGTELDPYIVS